MTEDQNIQFTDNAAESILDNRFLRHRLRWDHNRIGFSVLLLMGVWTESYSLLTLFLYIVDTIHGTSLADEMQNIYLFINEAFLFLGIVITYLILAPMPKAVPQKQKVSVGFILKFLCILFAVTYVCNLPTNFFLGIWNFFTKRSAGNDIQTLLENSDLWQSFLFVGIVAPILEEFFFRKLLIDRLRVYGDRIAIIVSALFFGLFHTNFSQFFYAVGTGIILGYVYCKTGRIWVSTLLHSIFNICSGVISTWLLTNLISSLDVLAQNLPNTFTPELIKTVIFFLLFMTYLSLGTTVFVIGTISFFKGFRKVKLAKGDNPLPLGGIVGAIIGNPGMISAISVLTFFTLLSLLR